MAIYPRLFADFRHTSSQEQTTQAKGVVRWHCPPGDILPAQAPSAIILTDEGLTAEYYDRFVRLGYDGAPVWQETRDPQLRILAHQGIVFYRGRDGFLHGVDAQQKQLLSEFTIPNCFDRGGVQLVFPVGEDHFVIQTYNRAHEVREDQEPENDDFSFFLMGPADWNDWDWLEEFEGQAMPGLIAGDGASVAFVNDQNEVVTLDLKTGKEANRFSVQDGTIERVSLDRDDHLVAVITTDEDEQMLRNYSLAGDLQWECLLSTGGDVSPQPPAIDGDNRVYCLIDNSLQVIQQGKLQWQAKVPSGRVRYLTILGDNSVVIVGGLQVDHLDRDGRELLSCALEAGAVITAPAVADDNGYLYLGTSLGIYCLE